MGSIGGHKRSGLCQYRDQRILPQEGRFTRHVWAGDQPQAVGFGKIAVIGDKPAITGGGKRGVSAVTM